MATNPNVTRIRSYLELEWPKYKSDCSGYLKAVAVDLGIKLTGQANDIVKTMRSSPWNQLGNDMAAASDRAAQGDLVVVGLQEKGHGHVAILVPGTSNKYARAYWGSLGGVGKKDTGINYSFTHAQLKEVEYFYLPLPNSCLL